MNRLICFNRPNNSCFHGEKCPLKTYDNTSGNYLKIHVFFCLKAIFMYKFTTQYCKMCIGCITPSSINMQRTYRICMLISCVISKWSTKHFLQHKAGSLFPLNNGPALLKPHTFFPLAHTDCICVVLFGAAGGKGLESQRVSCYFHQAATRLWSQHASHLLTGEVPRVSADSPLSARASPSLCRDPSLQNEVKPA